METGDSDKIFPENRNLPPGYFSPGPFRMSIKAPFCAIMAPLCTEEGPFYGRIYAVSEELLFGSKDVTGCVGK